MTQTGMIYKNFDTQISVTKVLCIILMVIEHSECPFFE